MKKKLFTLAALAACLMMPGGASADTQQYLVLSQTDGTVTRFALADQPVVSFDGGNLVVTCQQDVLTVALGDVGGYSFETRTDATAIDRQDAEPQTTMAFGEVTFSGLKENDAACVYTTDGRLIATVRADGTGQARLSLRHLPQGVYILRAAGKSMKVNNK